MNHSFRLDGKKALVTGASRGIGQALAIGLAAAGAAVICSSSREGGCDETLNKIKENGDSATAIAVNLSDRTALTDFVENVGDIDILLNNGGTIERYPATDFPMKAWDHVIQVNLSALFYLSQQFGTKMIKKGSGKIINIASMLSYTGGITVPAYTASKHGVAGVTKALANEWAQHNVQINAIAPGYIKTDNTAALQADKQRYKSILSRIPAAHWGEPEHLVGAAIFLASDASNYINGTIINVDGGWMAR
ncbi:MAG: SDR family NAD(P)-dependent oxidoreductase [Bacteroidota bacterium]